MQRSCKAWLQFLSTRLIGCVVDTLVMAFAYWGAFALRLDFAEPRWGWHAVAQSFITVWGVQLVALIATGCYALPWRRTKANDIPRYLLSGALSAALLTALRFTLNDTTFANIRPPYSITIINTILFMLGVLAIRGLWHLVWRNHIHELDLLARPEAHTDSSKVIQMLHGASVAVTGAGGTIGSELVRQVLACGPAKLLLIERSENALYQIEREVRALGSRTEIIPIMADIADRERMHQVFTAHRPAIIFHAAAYKHVPMVEANPRAGLENNTLATRSLGEVAIECKVAKLVMISTDKAVNPVGIMGITKRLAEVLLLDLNQHQTTTTFAAVRFGNVLGSSGSVVPLFREQIDHHGPVTVTHREMRRYFMSTLEAVSLVLQAGAIAKGGEIFVLDMGKPIYILDLAEQMIAQRGYRAYVDIPIVFTGIRPGEKLFEELDVSERSAFRTDTARVFISRSEGYPTATQINECLTQHAQATDVELAGALRALCQGPTSA